MTHEELMMFKKEVADPRMREIFAKTEIPEGMCCIDKVEIGFLDGRSCGFESVIEASGLQYANGKVQEFKYSETDVSVDEFVEAHKGCAFISDGALRVYDELDQFEINTALWNHARCGKVFDGLEGLEKLDFRSQSIEFEKMKAIFEGSPLVKDGQREVSKAVPPRKVSQIEWDVECKETLDLLPKEMEIPEWVEDEDISDYLSDVTGFCHKGFVLDDVAFVSNRNREEESVTLQNAVAIEYKGIIFDDWQVDEETQGVWAEMCANCAEKYKDLISGELDDAGAIGICSVDGCTVSGQESDGPHYYIDFEPELIHPLSKEQYEELKRTGTLEEKIREASGERKEQLAGGVTFLKIDDQSRD